MPNRINNAADLPLAVYAGLVNVLPPRGRGLPAGASPNCQDCTFPPANVATRPGLLAILNAAAGTPQVNYAKTFRDSSGNLSTLIGDSLGALSEESPLGGAVGLVASGKFPPNAVWQSRHAFGREYIATSDGKHGLGMPTQYDGVNLDRVSQCAPGTDSTSTGLSAADLVATSPIPASPTGLIPDPGSTIVASPRGLTESGTTCTVTLLAESAYAALMAVGDTFTIAGAGVAGYNGTWVVSAIGPAPGQFQFTNTVSGLAASGGGTLTSALISVKQQQFESQYGPLGELFTIAGASNPAYNGTWPLRGNFYDPVVSHHVRYDAWDPVLATSTTGLAASGGGTLSLDGNITMGKHLVTVFFITRQGYWTKYAPPVAWVAGGALPATIQGIPIGPPNVVARGLAFTAAGGASFYHVPSVMLINDNVTTSVNVDFSDTQLLAGTSVDYLLGLVELGEVAGFFEDSGRLWAWGERSRFSNVVNMTFDGGFSGSVPLGWTPGDGNGDFNAGGSSESVDVVWGFAYRLTAGAGLAEVGAINQSFFDWTVGDVWSSIFGFPVPIISFADLTAHGLSVRAKVKRSANLNAGTFRINLFSPSLGSLGGVTGLAVTATQAGTSYQEFIAPLWAAGVTTPVPNDAVIQLYADGAPGPNGESFLVDDIQFFRTDSPYNIGAVRVSRAASPESFDGVTGLIQPEGLEGRDVRCIARLRDLDYILGETGGGIFVTQDNGVNEPSFWAAGAVDNPGAIGTVSVNGVAQGDGEWLLIVDRGGLYIFDGRAPVKISDEIQPTWDSANWTAGQTAWIATDAPQRRALLGLPFGAATLPSQALDFEWVALDSAQDIITAPPVHVTLYGTSKVLPKSRKWSPWNMAMNCATMLERQDGTLKMCLGNGAANGKVYQVTPGQRTDDGAPILSFYWTHFFPDNIEQAQTLEQRLQKNSNRWDVRQLMAYAEGAGKIQFTIVDQSGNVLAALPRVVLASPGPRDIELPLMVTGEAIQVQVATDGAAGSWFQLGKLTPWFKAPAWSPVRGAN